MPNDPTLPKDAASALDALHKLHLKDQNDELCRYPTCFEKRKVVPHRGGRQPSYCENPQHTPQTSIRARADIANLAKGLPAVQMDTEGPITSPIAQSLRDQVLISLDRFQKLLGLYVETLREISDPDITTAQIDAAHHRADASISAAQENVEMERSLRLASEHVRDTAQRDAQAARQETEQALLAMQAAEQRVQEYQQQLKELQESHQHQIRELQEAHQQHLQDTQEDYLRQIEALNKDHQTSLQEVQKATQSQVTHIEERAKREREQAQQAVSEANQEAKKAEERARKAEILVSKQEQQIHDAHTNLKREQDEVSRLRHERDTQKEIDFVEIQRLREELSAIQATTRQQASDDRAEIKTLRENLAAAIKRADEQARLNDDLRTQLFDIHLSSQKANIPKQEKEQL